MDTRKHRPEQGDQGPADTVAATDAAKRLPWSAPQLHVVALGDVTRGSGTIGNDGGGSFSQFT